MSSFKVGVSTCLLGENVRYDGGHKLDRWIRDTLGQYVTFVPVCPEVECGLPVPRETMRLVGTPDNPRLVTRSGNDDHTLRMKDWAKERLARLEQENLCGFIFKAKSPSSGMERVKVYSETNGMPSPTGVGIFARAFMDHFPLLPVEEDGRLHDSKLRENFIERLFTMQRWRAFADNTPSAGGLVRFHSQHKLLLLSHSTEHYRQMGKLVAAVRELAFPEALGQYQTLLMQAMTRKSTPAKHRNVLQHAMGYFKKDLAPDEKQEMLELIDTYVDGHVPLIVPITLLNHFVRKYSKEYLAEQFYLHPHPIELQLRNTV